MSEGPSPSYSSTSRPVSNRTCEVCHRSFARTEHLRRHRRIHTNEKPFGCPFCYATFPRADVKDKHMRRVHREEEASSPRAKKARLGGRARSKLACDQCRRGKLKCDNLHPCQACRNKGIDCTVSTASRRPGRPRTNGNNSQILENALLQSTSVLDYRKVLDVPGVPLPDLGESIATRSRFSTSVIADGSSMPMQRLDGEPCFSGAELRISTTEEPGTLLALQDEITAAEFDAIFPSEKGMFLDGIESMSDDMVDMDFNDPVWPLPLSVSGWLDHLDNGQPAHTCTRSLRGDPSTISPIDVPTSDDAISMMVDYFSRRSRASSPTRQVARRSWYSSRPGLHHYDRDVINILLNVGRAHISTTFPIFSNFVATNDTSQQLCLAMAAIGALYSTAEGSNTAAKTLYNDARILQLDMFLNEVNSTFISATNSAKTFLLLEMYAVCSGNKRAYEFLEAFHYTTIEAFRACWQTAPRDTDDHTQRELAYLTESLHVLDSYRVLLLSRPPCLLSSSDLTVEMAQAFPSDHRRSMASLESIMTPIAPLSASFATLQNLARLSAYVWMSSPRGQESARHTQAWKAEFIELGLERWMYAKSLSPEDVGLSELLIYRLAYINLYSNLSLLQRYAHVFIDPVTCAAQDKNFDGIQAWVNGHDYSVVQWHAEATLRLIKNNIPTPYRRHHPPLQTSRCFEPPHLPYCIYFATLIVWYGGISPKSSNISRNYSIEMATQLLERLEAPVSKVVSAALCELLVDSNV